LPRFQARQPVAPEHEGNHRTANAEVEQPQPVRHRDLSDVVAIQLEDHTRQQQDQSVAGCSRNHGKGSGGKRAATEEVVGGLSKCGAER
jgi:hypothetical protein